MFYFTQLIKRIPDNPNRQKDTSKFEIVDKLTEAYDKEEEKKDYTIPIDIEHINEDAIVINQVSKAGSNKFVSSRETIASLGENGRKIGNLLTKELQEEKENSVKYKEIYDYEFLYSNGQRFMNQSYVAGKEQPFAENMEKLRFSIKQYAAIKRSVMNEKKVFLRQLNKQKGKAKRNRYAEKRV